jgi:hypothetical protein
VGSRPAGAAAQQVTVVLVAVTGLHFLE